MHSSLSARVYLMVMDHTTLTPLQAGVYEDLVVKTSKGWLFKQRQLQSDPRPQTEAR